MFMSTCTRTDQNAKSKTSVAAVRSASIWGDGLGLTEKQECFAQFVADGLNYSAAYRQAYVTDDMVPNTVWREAHRLSRNEKVSARIAQLVSEREEESRLRAATRACRVLGQLEEMMLTGKTDNIRLRAAEMLGRASGVLTNPTEPHRATKTVDELEQKLAAILAQAN
jgi:hypothetical protein